jgi:signal transduction histidine kinase
MKPLPESPVATGLIAPLKVRGRIFRKYVALFVTVVCATLITNGLLDVWFSYQEQEALLIRIQRGQAEVAAGKISNFVEQVEAQIKWTTQLAWSEDSLTEHRTDALRVLRLVPSIMELSRLDPSGHEQLHVSQLSASVIGSNKDLSQDPKFIKAMANQVYYGPVHFHQQTEPYMTLAVGGKDRDAGATIAEISLKYIWDVVSGIKAGQQGVAYVVDSNGKLIAHTNLDLVLRNTDLSGLAQVQAARRSPEGVQEAHLFEDMSGRQVLTAYAPIASLGWLVFVDLPAGEAFEPIYSSIRRSAALLLVALMLAALAGLYLAHKMLVPIRALREGAARITGGELAQRIMIYTGDELEALGDQFNTMVAKLQDSQATLERMVQERTHQLELANLAKSRFLATASHDLRQPLQALGLFVAHLRARMSAAERKRTFERIEAALAALNELFSAILDISKLDAGVEIRTAEFPASKLLSQIENTFAGVAQEKGLSLRVVPTTAWVRSDFILLERILLNLMSNAVRYTSHGGVLVGCRKRGGRLCFEVWDTGPGIPTDQREKIFDEFYRLGDLDAGRQAGLGLGLAIVDRLCRLLDHPLEMTSTVGRGSRFAVSMPMVAAGAKVPEPSAPNREGLDAMRGKLIVVIDDDEQVLNGMEGLFRSWGCRVMAADSAHAALTGLAGQSGPPDLIVTDYRLSAGKTGIEAIELVRNAFSAPISALLVSGDINPEPLRESHARGFHLLHKPVNPMTLRAVLGQMFKTSSVKDCITK